jgi:hypothetical protein
MSDSSSDEDPLLRSPDASDDDSGNSDMDVFTFKAQKFQKTSATNKTPPSSTRRKRKLTSARTVEDRLLQMDRKKEQQQHQKKTALKSASNNKQSTTFVLSDDSDDGNDSDNVEITSSKPAPALAPVVPIPLSGTPTTGRKTRSRAPTNPSLVKPLVLDLLQDSSDDDEAPLPYNVFKSKAAPCSKDALDVLERSRQAASSLRNAQTYHAEDIYVPRIQTTTFSYCAPPSSVTAANSRQPPQNNNYGKTTLHNTTNLGPNLSLKLRRRNGKQFQETVLKHRQRASLQSLLDQYRQQQGLTAQQTISFKFDGQTLKMNKTPVSYDMEGGDLIDVEVSLAAAAAAIRPATATSPRPRTTTARIKQNLGPTLALKLQRRTGKRVQETVLKHRQREPLQALLDQYKTHQKLPAYQQISMHFDGESLNMNRTPASYDMEAGDLIDVVIR